jgi:transposase
MARPSIPPGYARWAREGEEEGGLLISSRMMALVEDMRGQWAELDRRIGALDDEMVEHARNDETVRRLISIPGSGALSATALIAAVGDAGTFARARDLAAWLGLVPRQGARCRS